MTDGAMNADRLLAHYERIVDAPDAIARLRRFILDLAVRGKLVPQNPRDEPASELLTRIAMEKARLLKAQLIARVAPLPPITFSDAVFERPKGWEWVRLGNLTKLVTSGSRDWAKHYSNDGAIFVRMGNLSKDHYRLRLDHIQHVKPPAEGEGTRTRLEAGDILISITGDVGMLGLIPEGFGEAYINQHTAMVRPVAEMKSRYLAELFRSPFAQAQFNEPQRGIKNSFRLSDVTQFVVPLPPLAEQHRIVAKVDELMALCDRLEAARAEREKTRDRLSAASLARLNVPDPDPATFAGHARFALDNLASLTTRPDQIKQLRQTILNLAVRGKLVPQDPNDEPILATLNWAMERRAALVKAKKVRAKKLDRIDDLKPDGDLPSSWVLERLGNLVDPENTISYGVLVPGEEVPDGIPFVRAQDLALSGHPERPNKTIAPEIEKAYARTRLRGGEILVCVVGSIGKLGIVPQSWAGANIARAVARILPISEISREYLLLVLRGEPVQSYFNATTRTLAQPTLNVGLIEQTPIPLPPLAEQHRIVAKVDELMALCDRLEASLTAAVATRRRLLNALLAEALEPALQREAEAAE